jgi:hypothetical protein
MQPTVQQYTGHVASNSSATTLSGKLAMPDIGFFASQAIEQSNELMRHLAC